MEIWSFVIVACFISASLTMDRNSPTDDESALIQRVQQQSKLINRKTEDPGRKRRKFRRLHRERNPANASQSFNNDEYEDEYNKRIRSFASAIKDTDTFLKFLKQEETKHLGNYVRRRDFNFNNRTLTTRFLQTPPPERNDLDAPKEFEAVTKEPELITAAPTALSHTIINHTGEALFFLLPKPSPLLSPPYYSEKPQKSSRTEKKLDFPVHFLTPGDEPNLRVPNRGLVPPFPSSHDNLIATPTPTVARVNVTESIERRAPLPVKKKASKPKNKMPDRYLRKPDDDYDELQLSVAETAYYRKRPLTTSRLRMAKQYDAQQVIPGIAGQDYSVYSQPPVSGFTCKHGSHGYFADVNTGCQVFYICTGDGRGEPLLCPNGTLFNQEVLVCDWWYNVVCS